MGCTVTYESLNPQLRQWHHEWMRLRVDGYHEDRIKRLISELEKVGIKIPSLEEVLDYVKKTGKIERDDFCYGSRPLTGLTAEQQTIISEDHPVIIDAIRKAGKNVYNSQESVFNPKSGLVGEPDLVSAVNTILEISGTFVELTCLTRAGGIGFEERTAIDYLKLPLFFVKKTGIPNGRGRELPSRQLTGAQRIIVLEYADVNAQKGQITDVVKMLSGYKELGVGECNVHGNVMIGYEDGRKVCLKGLVESAFPHFRYDFSKYSMKA